MTAVLPQRLFSRPRKRYVPDGPHQNMSLAQRDPGEETMSKTVTKADIAKSICAQSDMKQQHAKKVLDAMLGIMKKALKEEKEMLLSGFGKFEAFTKKNRKGRNPQTGEEITLDAHDVLAFRISRKFKAAMNSEQ